MNSLHGIEGHPAPGFTLPQALDASGQRATAPLTLAGLTGRHKLLYCFQSWCAGCHQGGFPTLARVVAALEDRPDVLSVAVIQVSPGSCVDS